MNKSEIAERAAQEIMSVWRGNVMPFNEKSLTAIVERAIAESQGQTPTDEELSQGTFACPECGRETPHCDETHAHDAYLKELTQIRAAFQETTVPGKFFGRLSPSDPTMPYSDPRTEELWEHFRTGWLIALKKAGRDE